MTAKCQCAVGMPRFDELYEQFTTACMPGAFLYLADMMADTSDLLRKLMFLVSYLVETDQLAPEDIEDILQAAADADDLGLATLQNHEENASRALQEALESARAKTRGR